MQSLDSRQEADLIINNTLLKLKGSSNNNSTFRHTAATTQLPHVSPQQRLHQQQYNNLEFQQQSSQTHLSNFPQQYQTTLLSPILNSSTGASSSSLEYIHPTPTYVFDGVDSLSDYTNISEQDLFATVDGCQPETHSSSNLSSFTNEISPSTLLSNINSITSPSPVVPDKILSTPSSASSSSPPSTSNYIKTEKFPQISDNVTATVNNLYYNSAIPSSPLSSTSSNSKKRKLSPVTNFNDTLQSLLSDGILQTNFNASTTNSCMQTVSNARTTNTVSVKNEPFSVGDELQQFHQQKSSVNLNYLQSPSTATIIGNTTKTTSESTSTLNNNPKQQSTLSSRSLTTNSGGNHFSKYPHSAESTDNPSATATASTSGSSSNFFDIHDKIRQLYNLLIRDEKTFKEIRRRHRTRSFVLERLVERERLNKIVLNLYPGNQGYSLAVYQDTRNPNEQHRNDNQFNYNIIGNSSNNATGGTSSTSSLSTLLTTGDNVNNLNINGNASSINNISSGNTDAVSKDGNLIEIARWDYEMDDLLSCIDKEELPVLFLDLLESARIPNVFYSGCVICQVRDFRQTFLISSKSCDIYHVLLKPTNDSLYSDVNRIALKSDISSEDKLLLESQLVLATSEPLCLDPDPNIGRYAINSQHKRQIWNTPLMRRQMKKYSRNSINRKRKIIQFTHNYGLDIYDYLQKNHRSKMDLEKKTINTMDCDTINSNNNDEKKLPELKNPKDVIKPISAPNLNYPPLILPKVEKINPLENYLQKYAPLENYLQKYNALENYLEKIKALENYFQKYEKPKYAENKEKDKSSHNLTELKEPIILFDCGPQLTEEYILETGRECGRIYHIKLSIFQRPATFQYLGELYVDRDYKEGQRNGEACKFSLGTISHAKRYIEQFRDIFTEEGRKSVTIIHNVPGKEPVIEHTGEHTEHVAKQSDLPLTFQQQQQPQQQQQQQSQILQQHTTQPRISAITQTAQQQIQIQQTTPQLIAPTINTANSSNLSGNPLNINLQGTNIVGITTSGNIQQIRQRSQQMFDAALGTRVNVQTAQPTQQLSLSNGSLVLVQQQPSGATIPTGLAIQTAGSSNGQQKTQVITNANQLAGSNATIRTQLGSSVPFLEAQLKAAPLTVTGQHRIIQRKTPTTIHSTNPTFNAIVNGLMNTANQFQQQQSTTVQQQLTSKSSSDATILSILNSTPAAMTGPSAIVANTFNAQHGQQSATLVQQSNVTADSILQQSQQQQSQQQQLQRKHGEIVQNIFAGNLRKINMITGSGNATALGSSRTNATNLIAVSTVGLNQDQVQQTQTQNVQVTMSALASQLASPPAVMTNTNFGYTTAVTNNSGSNNNNNNLSLNNTNSIKILNSGGQRVLTAATNTVRRDSIIGTTAVPSPGSDSNASNASSASHSNLGFTMPGLSALLTTSPSPSSDQVQAIHNAINNGNSSIGSTLGTPTLIERLNSGTNISTSPGLSPHQQQQSQQQQMNIVAKTVVQQHNTNVQSPANSISPLSSPPPQSSPQNANIQQQQSSQPTATTLNLSGINFSNLQGAVATISNLQNVQVQIPGLPHPISLQLSGSSLAAAVQQQQQAAADGGGQQINTQQTSLLVSVPVTSTTQVNTIQSAVPGIANCGNVVSVPATATGTQTVVLTNSSAGSNSSGGSVLSLPVAQLVPSGVKNINAQALRTTTTIPSGGNSANLVNANLIQTASGNSGNLNTVSTGTALAGTISLNNSTVGGQPIQLLGTLQQRHRGIVVGTKQLANRVQLEQQRNLSASTLKVAAPGSNSSQTANLTANPLVMSTQKVQFKLQKQPSNVQPQHQQQQIVLQHQQQQQLQIQQQNMQLSGGNSITPQRIMAASAIAIANQNQKRRRSATDVNK